MTMRFSYRSGVAIIYTIVLFLDRLDLTLINIALPTLAKFFKVSTITTDWVNLSFLIALAISIPISTDLAERFGYKKIYIIAILLFGLSSMLCIFSVNLSMLILLRFMQGLGGGLLIPIGMTILYRLYEPAEYASIAGLTAMPALIAPALGPFIGGLLLEKFGWKILFFFLGPACVILAIFSLIILKKDNYINNKNYPKFDYFGFMLSSLILIDIFLTLSRISHFNIINLSLLIITIFIFIRWENFIKNPLINLKLFKNRVFTIANFLQFCFQSCHFGAMFLIVIYLQEGLKFSASLTGLIMGMQAIGAILTMRFTIKLINQFSAKLPLTLGFLGLAVLNLAILFIHNIKLGLLIFLIRGIFSSFCGLSIQTLSIINFEKKELGAVNRIFNASRQISISFGIACSALLLKFGLHYANLQDLLSQSTIQKIDLFKLFSWGFVALSIFALMGLLITQLFLKKNSVNIIK